MFRSCYSGLNHHFLLNFFLNMLVSMYINLVGYNYNVIGLYSLEKHPIPRNE